MKQTIDNQTKAALIERSVVYNLSGIDVVPFLTAEAEIVQQLWQAKQIVTRLTRSTVDQFSLAHKATGTQLQLTDLGKEVLHLLLTSVSTSLIHYPNHRFDPRVELFLDCMDSRNLAHLWQSGHPLAGPQLIPFVDAMNGFAHNVRKRAATSSFKSKLVIFHEEIDKRRKKLQDYFNQLCALYPASQAIRMDFSYRPGQPLGAIPGKDMYQQVRAHGEALLTHMKVSLGSALVGFAWTRDYASARGYQYHVVAVLNGPQTQELNNIVGSLGEEWSRVITGGVGLFFNCHGGRGHNFQHRGLIAMNHYAKPIQEHLMQVPMYMAQTDGLIAFAPLGKEKPYGMGTLLKVAHTHKKAQPVPAYQEIENVSFPKVWPFSMSMPTGLL